MTDATDHDQLFKEVIRDWFPDFLRLFAPRYAGKFDFGTLSWLDKELFPNPPDGPQHVLDLVARLRPTEAVAPADTGTEPAGWLALVHIEIESPDATTSIESRLPDYYHHLRAKYRQPVLPIVLYLKVALEGLGVRDIVDRYFDLDVRTLRYLYAGLPGLDAAAYLASDNWLGVALSALMRVPKGMRVAMGVEAMRRIGEAPLTDHQRQQLGDCVETYIDIPDEELARFRDILEANATGRVPAMNKTRVQLAEERGQLLTRRADLIELLETRFGSVPADVSDRVNAADEFDTLRAWFRAAVTIPDLDAFRTLIGHQP